MGVVVRPVGQPHPGQQLPARLRNVLLVLATPLLGQQLPGEGDILQGRVLGEEVEVLEYQAEVKPLLADVLLRLGGGVRGVKDDAALHGNGAMIRPFQEVQTTEQSRLAGTGGTDDGEGLPLLQGKTDIAEDLRVPEVLFNVLDL